MNPISHESECEVCRTLIDEEGYRPLMKLGMRNQIAPRVMIQFCDAIGDASQVIYEGKPCSLALLVGEDATFNEVLAPSIFSLKKGQSINVFRKKFHALAGLIDGKFLLLTANKKGKITGIRRVFPEILGPRYESEAPEVNSLYTGVYRHMAVLSRMTGALAFYVPPKGNTAKIFDRGKIVAIYRHGNWHEVNFEAFRECLIEASEQALATVPASRGGESEELFRMSLLKLMRVAFFMSTRGSGTILCLDAKMGVKRRRKSRLSEMVELLQRDLLITNLEDEELANIASLDGAVLVDGEGRLREFNAILPSAATDDGADRQGARHEAARTYSVEKGAAIVIAVSQDGGITGFYKGETAATIKIS